MSGIIPSEISNMFENVKPYLIFDVDNPRIKEDAPESIKKEFERWKQEFSEWIDYK